MYSNSDCGKTVKEYNIIEPPENTDLPFFTYGFYKPHQLAYSQIEKFVKGTPKKSIVRGMLKQVNGIPVLIEEEEEDFFVEGYLIYFEESMENAAYEKVGYSRNKGIYKWKEVKVGEQKANVLISSKPYLFYGDGHWYNNYDFNRTKYVKQANIHLNSYDWRKDPLFKKPMDYINFALRNVKSTESPKEDYFKFLEIQMLYMLLWMSIDRFLTFRYGETKKNNVIYLSEEKSFKKALQKYVDKDERMSFFNTKKVFSARDLKYYELNPDKPACSAMFYYTIRNNVVHNGKTLKNEQEMLLNALKQLLNIFGEVVEDARRE